MFWAIDMLGQPIDPAPGVIALCPLCHEKLIPKCGEQITWHFAHEADEDCDPWAESEGPWHKRWKSYLPRHQREVVLGPHRADLVAAGRVIELQHSSLSVDEVFAREAFYRKMVWLFDLTNYRVVDGDDYRDDEDEDPGPKLTVWRKEHYWSFYWAHPKRSCIAAKSPVFLDLGDFLFQIREARPPRRNEYVEHKNPHSGSRTGWGKMWAKERFLRSYLLPEPVAKTQKFTSTFNKPPVPEQPRLL